MSLAEYIVQVLIGILKIDMQRLTIYPSPMLKIGLTGGPGTGKSIALGFFKKLKIKTVSSDGIVRQLQKPGSKTLRRIAKVFGHEFLKPSGSINRKKLRKHILENPAERKKLEKIMHPSVIKKRRQIVADLKRRGEKVMICEIPLLFEAGLERQFDANLLIASTRQKQMERLTKRDNISRKDALLLINSQMPLSQKRKKADYIITNNGTPRELGRKIENFAKKLKRIAKDNA